MKRFFALVLVFGLAVSLAFAAEDTIKLRTLGQSPLTKPVLDAATAKQVVKNYAEEIRKLENDALFFDLMEQLDQAEFENEIPPIGTVMRWMLFKDRKGVIRNLKNVEWVGQEQFQAFGFEILHEGMIYHFFVPKICGNICLSQIRKALPPPPPPKPIEPPKPAEPKTVTPVVIIPPPVLISPQPAPAQPPAKKHRPDFKLKFGPWIPWEPMTFSAENQNVDVQYNFNDYLPKYEKFVICEDEETGTIYLNEKNFPYQTGD
ncbi:MAG: hypothetical protein Q8N59_00445, partial [bacterium]|nr:hypothetical protein [bacterium]